MPQSNSSSTCRQLARSPARKRQALGLVVTSLAVLGCALTARAGVVVNEVNATISGGGAEWYVSNLTGTSNGLPIGGTANGGPGFGVTDAELQSNGEGDAFDNGAMVWVNDEQFVAPAGAQITPISVAAGPSLMSGLQVSVNYYAVQSAPLLRTQAIFTNPSNSPVTATITLTTNVGSDSSTQVIATSNGDLAFTTADRWIITDDSDTNGDDPTNTHVLAGPNTGLLTETGLTLFEDSGPEGVLARYSLTVPANSTRRLLFFNELNAGAAEAVTDAARYDTLPPNSPLLDGLSGTDRAQVANFQLDTAPSFGRLTGSGTVGTGRNTFSVEATTAQITNRGQLVYTDAATRRTVRSVVVNSVSRFGNEVQLTGTARINNGASLPFSASFVDNGNVGDTMRLSVGGAINFAPAVIRTGGVVITPASSGNQPG